MFKRLVFLLLFLPLLGLNGFAEEAWQPESYGRVRTTVEFYNTDTTGKKLSWYDMTTDAFLGFKATKDLGDSWTSTGVIEFDLQSADNSVLPQYMYVTLENSTMALNVGRQETSGKTFGGAYFENINNYMVTGETIGTGDYLKATFKEVDLTFVTGRHSKGDDASTTAPSYDESVLGLYLDTKLADAFPLALSVANIHEVPSPRRARVAYDDVHGNETYIGYSFSFTVPVTNMDFSFNYDNKQEKHNETATTSDKRAATLVLAYDLHLSSLAEGAGFSFIYSNRQMNDGTPVATDTTGYDLSFLYPFKGINGFVSLSTLNTVDSDDNQNDHELLYGAGLAYHFGK